jgi:hypothetical protein
VDENMPDSRERWLERQLNHRRGSDRLSPRELCFERSEEAILGLVNRVVGR